MIKTLRSVLLLPAALLASAIGWAAFWVAHDFVWSLLPKGGVWFPWLGLVVLYCGSGYLMGLPLGKWLRSGGLHEWRGAGWVCCLLVIPAALIGEFVYVASTLKPMITHVGFGDVVAAMIGPLLANNLEGVLAAVFQVLLRSLLAIGAVAGATTVLRPKAAADPERGDSRAS